MTLIPLVDASTSEPSPNGHLEVVADLPEVIIADESPRIEMPVAEPTAPTPPKRRRGQKGKDGKPNGKPPACTIDPGPTADKYLAATARDGLPTLRFHRDAWLHWRGGAYRELPASDIKARVFVGLDGKYSQITQGIIANVMGAIQAKSLLPHDVEAPAWIGEGEISEWEPSDVLVAPNGIIHLPSLVADDPNYRSPLTPRLFVANALDYRFDQDAPRPELWLAFLRQLWPDDEQSIGTLQDWMGYCLTADTRQQKILMLVGPKRSGKGTICRVQTALIGRQNVCSPTLASLPERFGLWPLIGKSLAIVADARLSGRTDQAAVVERLLSISGEDGQTIDRKNLVPLTCTLPTRLMLVSNELPRLSDSSGALTGRMILLRLTQSFFGREDHDLTDRLLTELPGILLWAVAGWKRLRERGRFVQPDTSMEMLADLADLSSPIAAYIRDCCIVEAGRQAAIDDLFGAWKSWCESQGRHPGIQQVFGRDLLAALPTLKRVRPRDDDGSRYRAYEGIGVR